MTINPVDASAAAAVMLSIGEIATREGVSKQAVSASVKRLVSKGLMVTRDHLGRVERVNAAHFDLLRGRFADPSKAQAPAKIEVASGDSAGSFGDSYEEALRRKTWEQAEMARLQRLQFEGRLVQVEDVEERLREAAEAIVRELERLPNSADDLAAVVAREGTHGLRIALKARVQKMRGAMVSAIEQAMATSVGVLKDDADEGEAIEA